MRYPAADVVVRFSVFRVPVRRAVPGTRFAAHPYHGGLRGRPR